MAKYAPETDSMAKKYIIQLNAAIQIFSFILSMLIDEYQRSILSQYLFDFSPLTEVKMHFDLATITT